ncbi:hypothetical protein MASR2M117_15410 [Paludibacter sp.]
MTKLLTQFLEKNHYIYKNVYNNINRSCFILRHNHSESEADYLIEIFSGQKLMFIYTIFPVKIPFHKRNDVSILLKSLNQQTNIGCWEMNCIDGVLKFRCEYFNNEDFEDIEHTLNFNLNNSIRYTDDCLPKIMSIIYANVSPKEVLSEAISK